MDTTHVTTPITPDITTHARAESERIQWLHPAVDRFLEAVQAGVMTADVYTSDATLDATVPGWRFHRHGADAVCAEYAGWFAAPGALEELERLPVADGEVVTYLLAWEEHGVPHAWRFGNQRPEEDRPESRTSMVCRSLEVARPHGKGNGFIEIACPG